jgi:predicted MFS family arabinose efflux permease
VWAIVIVTLINRTGTMVLPFLVIYLTKERAFTAEQAGLALVFYGLGSMITAPLAGKLCDRVGPLRVMRASLFLAGAILFVLAVARSFLAVNGIIILWAIVSEAFRPASLSIISEAVAPEQRKAAFSLNRLAINLGMSIGPAVGGFLAQASFFALFIVDGATSILAGIVLALTRLQTRPQSTSEPAREITSPIKRFTALADRRLLIFLVLMVGVLMIFFQNQAAEPLYLIRDLRLSESDLGLLFSVNTLLIILIEVPLNTAMAHWPHRQAVAFGALLTGVGFGALVFAKTFWSVAATVVVWTFGEMIVFPSSSAYVADLAPAEKRGVYMGLYVMTFSLAFMIGPWLGVAILDRFGAATLWGGTLACGCLAAVIIFVVHSVDADKRRAAGI